MFGRKQRKTEINATKSYLVEITRAIMKHTLGTDVYLTQIEMVSTAEEKPGQTVRETRSYATEQMIVTLGAFFTSVDYPRRHGREGQFPLLPKMTLNFILTNEAAGWRNWQILRVKVSWENFYEPKTSGEFVLWFDETPAESEFYHLVTLAKELEHRRPASIRTDE